VEVITLGLGAAAAYISKDGIEKLLGPTADYLGKSLAEFTQKRIENVGKIFQSAERKLGSKIDAPGEVPPKILKSVLDEGSFASDPLTAEYFGGILASSRSENGRDDRGARLAKIVDSLSTYQLRCHFLVYGSIRQLFRNQGLSMAFEDREKMQIFIPFSTFAAAMDFSQQEADQANSLIPHIFFGLSRDGLIADHVRWGPKESVREAFAEAPEGGAICSPSAFGVELYLSAFGHNDKQLDFIFDANLDVTVEGIPSSYVNVMATKNATDTTS